MKYIITDNRDVVIHISDTIGYQENGNVLVDNDTLAIAKPLVKEVYEVENVDEGICESKYCYTETDGFYVNPNYVEPKEPIETRVDLIEERVTLAEDMINMSLGF